MDPRVRERDIARLRPAVERAGGFRGWEFSGVRMRRLDPAPGWDYEDLVSSAAIGRGSVLDLGTGGGELLARIRPHLPRRTVATEEWGPNVAVARDRLHPVGVELVRCKSRVLPFAGGAFDLIIDRHEELDPSEVARVLAREGRLVTQQVGGADWKELREFFPRMESFGDLDREYLEGLREQGLKVEARSHEGRVAYADLTEFVFMLLVAPWTIPDFEIERDLEALLGFERVTRMGDEIVVTESRFLIVADKVGQ